VPELNAKFSYAFSLCSCLVIIWNFDVLKVISEKLKTMDNLMQLRIWWTRMDQDVRLKKYLCKNEFLKPLFFLRVTSISFFDDDV
jgi:hypothetical protein